MSRIIGSLILALAVGSISTPAPAFTTANSLIIQIPAIAFAIRDNSTLTGNNNQGVLEDGTGTYYAAVPFPVDGQRVCSFTLIHRDNDADSAITARLLKKNIVLDGFVFDPPIQMARVTTGVAVGAIGVRSKTDVSIAQPLINLRNAFYYVELTLGSNLLEVLGVQIEVNPTCSAG